MAEKLTRRSIVKKTIELGFFTVTSKAVGFVRDILMVRYLGVTAFADIFNIARSIPSSLRKIVAEGALNVAVVPTLVKTLKEEGKDQTSRVSTVLLIALALLAIPLCLAVVIFAPAIISVIAPGWKCVGGIDRCLESARMLRIMIFFAGLAFGSALFACVLQAVHQFNVPMFGQIIFNLLLVFELWCFDHFSLPLTFLAVGFVLNGVVYLLICFYFYRRNGFSVARPDRRAFEQALPAMKRFVPCVAGLGAVELCFFIDRMFTSYLPTGSISMFSYTYALARAPLQVFATVFATVLLPHFSRVSSYAPRRLSFHLFEAAKTIWWVIIPAMVLMMGFSYQFFYTFLLSDKFPIEYVAQGSVLLNIFLIGLFFFSFDKILLTTFYSLHETFVPTSITFGTTLLNTVLNLPFMILLGLKGIMIATVLAEAVKVALLALFLRRKFNFTMYGRAFLNFFVKSVLQLAVVGWGFFLSFRLACYGITFLSPHVAHHLLETKLFWIWVCPLVAVFAFILYATRKRFGIRLHFLD